MEVTRQTKYFGEVTLFHDSDLNSGRNWVRINTFYKDESISICIENYKNNKDRHNLIWEIIDKYAEINEIAKMEMINKFPQKKEEVIKYFKDIYDETYEQYLEEYISDTFGVKDFKKINIKSFEEKNKKKFPDLFFDLENGIITVFVDYFTFITELDTSVYLQVSLDKDLNINNFFINW